MSSSSSPISILSVLTEDLLIRVYESLDLPSRTTWRLVCTDFLRIDSLRRLSIRVTRVEFLPALLLRCPNLFSLDLSVCPKIDDGVVFSIVRRGVVPASLKSLNLSRATGLRAGGLEALARACTSLESLDITHSWGFGDREAAALSAAATGMRELRMDKCLSLSDVGLAKIAVRCERLEVISLKWCVEISDLGIDLLCKKCKQLRFLDVSYLKITNDSIRSIASLPKLEVLEMVCCPSIDDAGLQFLENGCPLLQAIDITRCEHVSLSGLISVVRGHPGLRKLKAGYSLSELSTSLTQLIKDLKDLETFVIDGAHVSDSSLETISANCKFLIELGLSKCFGVTNPGMAKLVKNCVNLKSLNLTCCYSITDAAISSVAESCRKIVCLKLESCNLISEKGLYHLGSFCMLLEELDLTDCSGVNDRGLEYLSRCSNLLRLKLGLCADVSDKGLFNMSSNCKKLLELDLYRCMGIGDDGLAALSSGCKKLNKLILSYCNGLTDKGMENISLLEELSYLELRGLKRITGVGLAAIASGCKRLVYLDLKLCEKIDDSGFWALAYFSRNLRQINLSYCGVSDMALRMMMSNLTRLQDVDLVHLSNVTVEGFEVALRACCVGIKKVKLLAPLRFLLSSEILETLHASGCRIRWD